MAHTLVILYYLLWGVFALLGLRRVWLLWLYHRRGKRPPTPLAASTPPFVTVQLPLFNERYVVARLLQAVADLDWPREFLEVQVLDDSDDETAAVAAREVERLRSEGLDIVHLQRGERIGYKAGALEYGMKRAKGEFLLIFDADFMPPKDVLHRIIPHFTDPEVGMVQARWDHLNRDYSLLSRIQAIALDGHFVIEQEARAKSGLFFNFNGTAGVWRKTCIEAAGGWQHDTLTEDLDLSFRAHLDGWRFVYLPDALCPAELPIDMRAFKSQQFRWVKGSVQVFKKTLPAIWRSEFSWRRKIETSAHLAHNMTYMLVLALSLFIYPAVFARFASHSMGSGMLELTLFTLSTMSVFAYYGFAMRQGGHSLWRSISLFPIVMSVGIGLSVSNTSAVLEGLVGHTSPFHRTPKYAVLGGSAPQRYKSYRGLPSKTTVFELLLAIYFTFLLVAVIRAGLLAAIPFVALFLFGYLYVGWMSIESRS